MGRLAVETSKDMDIVGKLAVELVAGLMKAGLRE